MSFEKGIFPDSLKVAIMYVVSICGTYVASMYVGLWEQLYIINITDM